MSSAIRVEWWKLKCSPVTLTATILMVALLPAMGLGFYTVARQSGSSLVATPPPR